MKDLWLATGHSRRRYTLRRGFGFTLIELLITLALLIIMIVMLWGFGSRSNQQKQKHACRKNLQNVYVGLEIYANDFNGVFPAFAGAKTSEQSLSFLVPRYTTDTAAFICPGSKDDPLPSAQDFSERRISYAYFMGRKSSEASGLLVSDRQINTVPKAVGDQVFSTTGKAPGNNHHKFGGNYLFCDGRIETGGTKAPFAIDWPTNVTMLNPRP